MSFGTKYEIADLITRGRVKTHVARALATGEQVLVHIFSANRFAAGDIGAPQKVLEHLCRIAPQPPGEAIDCGQYEGTRYAFLVTRCPKSFAQVLRWADNYEEMPQDSFGEVEIVADLPDIAPAALPAQKIQATTGLDQMLQSHPGVKPEPHPHAEATPAGGYSGTSIFGPAGKAAVEQPRPDVFAELFGTAAQKASPLPSTPAAKPAAPDSFSSLFGTATAAPIPAPAPDALQKFVPPGEVTRRRRLTVDEEARRPAAPVLSPAPAPAAIPGEFTKMFKAPLQSVPEDGNKPATPLPHGEFTKLFAMPTAGDVAPVPDTALSASLPAAPAAAKPSPAKEGEFTQFFSSPFKPAPLKDAPAARPAAPVARQESKGGFTELFKSPMKSGAPERRFESVPLRREPGSFTRIFGAPHIPATPAAPAPAAAETPTQPTIQTTPAPAPQFAAAPPQPFAPPAPPATQPPVVTPQPAAAAPPLAPAGPSEFTRIVSGRALREALQATPPAPVAGPAVRMPAVAPPVVTPPAFAAPQITPPVITPAQVSAPYVTPPAMTPPAFTPPTYTPPAVQAPQVYMPPVTMPVPQYPSPVSPPQVAAPPPVKSKPNYLPLIIILNVLFVLAVALVLYFALKH